MIFVAILGKNVQCSCAFIFSIGGMLYMFPDFVDTEGGMIEAIVSHRKSSQQHTQAGPKKYTKIAKELKNNRAPPSAVPHRERHFAPPPVVIGFHSF